MRILHVWNIAAVPSTLAKYQKKLGHHTALIIRKNFTDLGIYKVIEDYVPVTIVGGSDRRYKLRCLLKARKFDVIHCHSLDDYAVAFKNRYRKKKVIITYHGTRIRDKWEKRKEYWSKLDMVTVATPDLLEGAPEGAVHIPNPVNIDHFSRQQKYKPNTALFHWVWDSQFSLRLAKEFADKRGLKLTVHRRKDTTFPYSIYPRILEQYEYYIDIKTDADNNKITQTPSVTSLQALSLGVKVYYNGEIHTGLPSKHNPITVAKQWIDLYNSM